MTAIRKAIKASNAPTLRSTVQTERESHAVVKEKARGVQPSSIASTRPSWKFTSEDRRGRTRTGWMGRAPEGPSAISSFLLYSMPVLFRHPIWSGEKWAQMRLPLLRSYCRTTMPIAIAIAAIVYECAIRPRRRVYCGHLVEAAKPERSIGRIVRVFRTLKDNTAKLCYTPL